jgi:hypothetical protein
MRPSRTRLRWIVPVVAAVSMYLVGQPVAQASVPTSYCSGRAYSFVVKNYTRGAAGLPIRCGSTEWGFRHITARWNAAFDANIALTIARGEAVVDYQQDGGSTIYALFDSRCNELFRVIYNGGAYLGTGVRPQGVITAYTRRAVITAAVPRTTIAKSAAAAYRTDCAVIQNI